LFWHKSQEEEITQLKLITQPQSGMSFRQVCGKSGRWLRRNGWTMGAGALAVTAVMGVYNVSATYQVGVEVLVNGQSLCVADSQQQVLGVKEALQEEISQGLGQPYVLQTQPTYRLVLTPRDEVVDVIELEKQLMVCAPDVAEMTVLEVDGQVIGATQEPEALKEMLEQIKNQYATGAADEVLEFNKEVVVQERLCVLSASKTITEMRAILESQTVVEDTYTAQEGDTYSLIAPRYGMSVSQLEQLNGTEEELHSGDVLKVEKNEPLLGVISTRTEQYEEAIPFETEEIETDTLYKSEKKTLIEGVEGKSLVTAKVVSINGEEVSREPLESEVLENPVTEVLQVGTKELPAFAGDFAYPTQGVFTSEFGPRWGRTHTGLDIANQIGTPIYASETGTVILAEDNGSYGLCIKIDHGDGFVTLYGHNSELLVKEGDQVAKGQLIAYMGSTGRSTGSHCHFEIRVNGTAVNPRLYLDHLLEQQEAEEAAAKAAEAAEAQTQTE
jgi:murein DD-endopeptidase MepM/ murein hydrolase activator NlpD